MSKLLLPSVISTIGVFGFILLASLNPGWIYTFIILPIFCLAVNEIYFRKTFWEALLIGVIFGVVLWVVVLYYILIPTKMFSIFRV